MTLYTHADQYRARGFNDIPVNHSGQGAVVLIDQSASTIVKFGTDYAYEVFINFVQAQPASLDIFPTIYHHAIPNGSLAPVKSASDGRYTCTELEVLQEINQEEKDAFDMWFSLFIEAIKSNADLRSVNNPFNFNDIYYKLWLTGKSHNCGLEQKALSCMVRIVNGRRQMVITDPLN